MKEKVKIIFGALLVSCGLLFISNFVGNTLIPSFSTTNLAKSTSHNWIEWPESRAISEKRINSVTEKLEQSKIKLRLSEKNKSEPMTINIEKTPNTLKNSLAGLLLAADIANGKKISRKCIACHSFKKGGKNKIGPNLFDILGQDRAAVSGFKYSQAIKKKIGKWSFADMDKFLLKPKNFIPKTKMSFRGIRNASDRAAIIMYMRSFAEVPLALPK